MITTDPVAFPDVPTPGGLGRRREPRHPVDSIVLPFLGSTEAYQGTFEYLVDDLSPSGIRIVLPRWLVQREYLNPGDGVCLNAPFRFQGCFYSRGDVAWARWDETIEAQICGVRMAGAAPPYYPVFISLRAGAIGLDLQDFQSPERLLYLLLKDMYLLKRGILIYLKHLVPFFYRIGDYAPARYADFKDSILEDIRRRVDTHARFLSNLLMTAHRDGWGIDDIPRVIDLGEVREAVESEIQHDLLFTALGTESARPYLSAIQKLEQKLYYSFNALMMLYIQALGGEKAHPAGRF